MTTVKEIFESQGYKYDKDGRNRTHRSLQALLDSGLVTFRVCQKGMVWTEKGSGVKYNVKVSIKQPNGNWWVSYIKSSITNIDSYDVLKLIGGVLRTEKVQEFMRSYVDIDSSCKKCNGVGIIPAFHYYCNGICFDCYGLGYNRKFRPVVEIVKQNDTAQ
jgi:hypothetical protein